MEWEWGLSPDRSLGVGHELECREGGSTLWSGNEDCLLTGA